MSTTLEVKGLTYAYPDGHKALDDITLAFHEGERVGIVGANGAGKSTLLLHLNGILQGTGKIILAGTEVTQKTLKDLRSRIGLVFQDPDDQLFSTTVFEDVAFGPLHMGLSENEVKLRVESSLKSVGMEPMSHRAPHRMSLGEKKLVAIATVLSMSPKILALDEPTSALDARSRRRLIQVLNQLKETIIVATHDLTMVSELLTRTVVLNKGKVVADGDTRDLLSDRHFLEENGLV